MTRVLRASAAAAAAAVVLGATAGRAPAVSAQLKRLEAPALVAVYAAGRFDEALAAVPRATRDQIADLRRQLAIVTGPKGEPSPAPAPGPVIASAAFALEVERLLAERDMWAARDEKDCAGRCVVEWACALLRGREAGDEAERLWMLAAVALAGGVRDWGFLHLPLTLPTERTPEQGHADHAWARWPAESRLRLARAIAIAARYAITDEMDTPQDGVRTRPLVSGVLIIGGPPGTAPLIERRRQSLLDYAAAQFAELVEDPAVGPEARMRLGYLQFRSGQYEQALASERAAAESSSDPDVKYVAMYLAAQAEQALGRLASAEAWYGRALEARPDSQSATLGIASLLYVRGEANRAYDLIDATRTRRTGDDDPWRMFQYGDFFRLPGLIAELRKRVTP